VSNLAVKFWYDYHGTPTLFRVMDSGRELACYPSEVEAIAHADYLRLKQEVSSAPSRAEGEDVLRVYLIDRDLTEKQAEEIAYLLGALPEE
jgi:hypothetical protein